MTATACRPRRRREQARHAANPEEALPDSRKAGRATLPLSTGFSEGIVDKHHKDMISSLKLAAGDEVLVPDYLFETLSKDLANARIIPYSATAQLKSPVPDRAIVHKGLMPRLPRQILQALVIHGDIVHANEV
jgi:hypothetical protein